MAKKQKNKAPKYVLSVLNNRMLNYQVYYMSAPEKLTAVLLTFLAGGFAGWIFYGGLFKADGEATRATYISNLIVILLGGFLAAKVFVPVIRESMKKKRDKALRIQFRDMLENLTASLAAGNTMMDAFINARGDLANQYARDDYIIIELTEILAGMQNGQTLESMLTAFGERAGNEDIQNFANVIANCYRMGGDFKTVVRKTRDIISDKKQIEEEIETKITSNKLQHNAMCLMPLVLVAMLKMMNSSFADNLASFTGVFVTTVALGIFIGAYFWGKKIIEIK